MQPDESKPGGITDSVISGDVHYHNTTQTGMQPDTIIIDPNTGLPQNVIIMQQPSAAPKVVGILIIIWGSLLSMLTALGIIGLSLITDSDSELYVEQVGDSPMVLYLVTAVALLAYIGQIVGG